MSWQTGLILVITVAIFVPWALAELIAYVDSRRPLTRADRRQMRTVRDGKRAMSEDLQ